MQWMVCVALMTGLAVAPGPAELTAGPAPPALQGRQAPPASHEAVDVNQASLEELQTIPGIGPAMAQRIVDWRKQHGPFERIDDLLNVRGIGVKTLEKLRPYVTVNEKAKGDAA